MIDRRKLARRHLIYYLRVFDRDINQLIGHVVDISTDGLKLISEAPIKTQETFRCEMSLPQEIQGQKKVIFDATSVWNKKDINPDFFATGFAISNIELETVMLIKRLIDEFGFSE